MDTSCPSTASATQEHRRHVETATLMYPAYVELPTARELHLALCANSPAERLCARVHALRELYHRLRQDPTDAELLTFQRAQLCREIVTHVAQRLARIDAARAPRAHTVAELIDRMAATADRALYLLETVGGADPRTHGVWTDLAQLELGYADLIAGTTGDR